MTATQLVELSQSEKDNVTCVTDTTPPKSSIPASGPRPAMRIKEEVDASMAQLWFNRQLDEL